MIDQENPRTPHAHPTEPRTPTPRTYNGEKYYCASDVAQILGVDRTRVVRWNNELWHGAQWFTADVKTHDGVYLYEIERVEQLKSVYRPDWYKQPVLRKDTEPAPERKKYPSKEERQKIRDAVRMIDPDTIAGKINLEKTRIGWVCPECGNGRGSNKTGIVPKYLSQKGDHVEWYCFACGSTCDNIALVAKVQFNYSVDEKGNFTDAKDFPKALEDVANLFGVYVDTDGAVHSPHAAKRPEIFDDANDEVDESTLKDYSNFYGYASGNLKYFMSQHDGFYRGIPKIVYDYFWCGYVSEFGNSKTPRFIVPTSRYTFLARFTGDKEKLSAEEREKLKEKWRPRGVSRPPFNIKRAAESDDSIIGVTEGEFDAISVFFASVREEFIKAKGIISLSKTPRMNTIALMSTSVAKKFYKRLRADEIGKKFFIVMLDNDEAGIKATPHVVKDLKMLGHDAVGILLSEKYNDANEFLQADPDAFTARIKEIYDAAKSGTLVTDKIFSATADDKQAEICAIEPAEGTETPTHDISVDEDKNMPEKTIEEQTSDFSDYESVHGKINPDIKPALVEGISFVKLFDDATFDIKELSTIKRRHQIAALKVYMPDLHDEFFITLKKFCKEAKKILRELDADNFFESKAKTTKQQNNEPIFSDFSLAGELVDFDVKNFQREVNELAREIKKKQTAFNEKQLRDHNRKRDEEKRARDKAAAADKFKINSASFDANYLFTQPDDDEGRATQLVYVFGSNLRYITSREQWLVFKKNPDYPTCGVWSLSNPRQDTDVLNLARKMNSILTANMPATADKDTDKMIQGWRNGKCMSNAIRLARVDDQVIIRATDLDSHPNLLLVKNGVIDLETKDFYPNVDKKLLLTKCCNAVWNPNADKSTVQKFLRDIQPDEESLAAMLRYLGYCMTGETTQQKLHFWKGKGANGKSTILATYKHLMGNHAVNIPASLLLEPKNPVDANNATPALAMLIGARVAISSELPQNSVLNSQLVKDVTGGEEMSVRLLHCNFENFRPFAKFIICGNFFPQIANVRDKGLLRRLQTLEFSQTFEDETADLNLPKRLLEEENLSALLNFIVDGAYDFYREGTLIESTEMKKSRRAYIADNDFIVQFIEEFCIKGDDKHCLRKEFLEELRKQFPVECLRYRNDRELGNIVEQMKCCRREKSKRGIVYHGFGLVGNAPDSENNEHNNNDDDELFDIPPEI